MDRNKEFLDKLTHLARCYGWRGDYTEISAFILWVYHEYGYLPPENLNPFNDTPV